MRRLLLALAVIFCSLPLTAQSPALPEGFPEIRFSMNPLYHSTGMKLGHILAVRRERPILSTYEGELMLGFGTSAGRVVDRACMQTVLEQGTSTRRSENPQEQVEHTRQVQDECSLFSNPWRFSLLNTAIFENLSTVKDRPAVIYYINYYITPSHILMKTKNQVLAVYPTDPDLKVEPQFRVPAW